MELLVGLINDGDGKVENINFEIIYIKYQLLQSSIFMLGDVGGNGDSRYSFFFQSFYFWQYVKCYFMLYSVIRGLRREK